MEIIVLNKVEANDFFRDWVLLLWKIHHKVASQEKFLNYTLGL